jgi:UPF0716 protein FxsA
MLRLLLLFTVVPALELWLLLQIGSWMGATQTFLLIVVTGTVGAWLAKREGLDVLTQLREELGKGLPGGSRLMEGALVVVGGLLLLTPGVMTDVLGFCLIAPPTRRWIAPKILAEASRRIQVKATVGSTAAAQPAGEQDPFSNPFDDLP